MQRPVRQADPDFAAFLDVVSRRKAPERVHFVELGIDTGIMARYVEETAGERFAWSADTIQRRELETRFYRLAGYDYVRPKIDFGFSDPNRNLSEDTAGDGNRSWACEGLGCIDGWATFESYPWPSPDDADFTHLDWALERVPDGMGVVLAGAGGVFEWATELLGLTGFCMLMFDQPDLVEAVLRRIGDQILACTRLALERTGVGAFFLGDDLGFKSATLVSPDDLRRLILPWHTQIARACHGAGVLYLLHSCGNLEGLMDDLIGGVGIDGKHSYEDVIMPVEEVHRRWGDRTAILGGVDLNILSDGTEAETRGRVRAILEACHAKGGYLLGSGNTIANYCRYENYLAMLDEGVRFSGL